SFEFFNRQLQFRRSRFLNAALIERPTPQIICRSGDLEYLAKKDSFCRVRSYVSATDFFEISFPCSDDSDRSHRKPLALRILNQFRQSLRCDGLNSLSRLANGNCSSLPGQLHDFVVRLRSRGNGRIRENHLYTANYPRGTHRANQST